MTTFDERERGFEAKFAHDLETDFIIVGRRDRLLGEWAGGLLGLSGEALAQYAQSVVRADVQAPGDEDVVNKVAGDLAGKVSEAEVRSKLVALLDEARAQVQAGA